MKTPGFTAEHALRPGDAPSHIAGSPSFSVRESQVALAGKRCQPLCERYCAAKGGSDDCFNTCMEVCHVVQAPVMM